MATPNEQDWTPMILNRSSNNQSHGQAFRKGPETVTDSGIPAWKVERMADEGTFKHKTVSTELKLKIQQGRQAKKWTQKDLARQTNLPLSSIQSYENGSAIPNGKELNLISRALGVSLK
jgi:ribosome-binding protein aMBF1 (putative translation factor)